MSTTLDKRAPEASPISGRSVLAVLGIWLGLTALLAGGGWYGAFLLAGQRTSSETPTLVAVFFAYAMFPAAALIVYRPSGVRDRLRFRLPSTRAFRTGLLVWLSILGAGVVVYGMWGLGSGSITGPALSVVRNATDMARVPHAGAFDWFLIVVRALLLAGITEELLFRGVLFGWLRRFLSAWPTILITAVAFTLEHWFLVLFPLVLLFGIAVGWLRERTGSVLPGLVVHILTDTLLFVIALVLLHAHVPA